MKAISLNPDTNRIEFVFPYSQGMVTRVKEELIDRTWDVARKVWWTPISTFHAEQARKFGVDYGFRIDHQVLEATRPRKVEIQKQREGLYPFQSLAVDFYHCAGGRLVNADEQGLGKTIETLAWMREVRDELERVLIVCPASVTYKWKDEITKWLPGWSASVVPSGKVPIPKDTVIIMSYQMMVNRYDELKAKSFSLIVADECHYLSNSKTNRTKCLKALPSPYWIGLSGTPFLNRPVELWSLLNIISPMEWKSWWNYVSRYCDAKRTYFGLDVSGISSPEELRGRIEDRFLRRIKQDVLKDLPELRRSLVPLDVMLSGYRKILRNGKDDLTTLGLVRHELGRLKVAAGLEIAKNILSDSGRKVVIYCWHKDVVDSVAQALRAEGFSVDRIVGDVPQKVRSDAVKNFQEGDTQVMVISAAGGEGIDLYRANDIIFIERAWNPGKEEQAEARLHRIGQSNPVVAHYLIVKGTIDEEINSLIENKRAEFASIFDVANIDSQINQGVLGLLRKAMSNARR